jgi:hypothetical protein
MKLEKSEKQSNREFLFYTIMLAQFLTNARFYCRSKVETTWVIRFDSGEHVIELRSSKITGKRQLKVNGLEIFKGFR